MQARKYSPPTFMNLLVAGELLRGELTAAYSVCFDNRAEAPWIVNAQQVNVE